MKTPANARGRWFPLGVKVLLALAAHAGLASPSTAQGPGKFSGPLPGRVALNGYLLPAFEKMLPKGRNVIAFKNPSHFEMVVQVRNGSRAAQFVLKGKVSQKIFLPDGEYTIFYRFLSERVINEGRSFLARGGEFFDDNGEPMTDERELTGQPAKGAAGKKR